jgi:hypothetical protein
MTKLITNLLSYLTTNYKRELNVKDLVCYFPIILFVMIITFTLFLYNYYSYNNVIISLFIF